EVVGVAWRGGRLVREVVDAAAAEAPEMVVAALQGAVVGQRAEMPLADEGRAIARFAQQRGESRMVRRQAGLAGLARDRLFETDGQAVLIAAGDERGARRGADGRV